MAIAFANIFMASIEKEVLSQSVNKPKGSLTMFLLVRNKQRRNRRFHWARKFVPPYHTLKVYRWSLTVRKNNFFGYNSLQGRELREKKSILDVRTHYKPTETFQYTNYDSCHPAGVKKGFVKGEALRRLRTNSSKAMFEMSIKTLEHAWHRGAIPITRWTKSSPKLNSQKERTLLHKNRKLKRTRKFYTLWHNFIHHCYVWNIS